MLKHWLGLAKKVRDAIWARWSLRKCNSVGRRCRAQGKVFVSNEGTIHIGGHVRINARLVPVELAAMSGAQLTIGDNTDINFGTSICAAKSVQIGKNCAIGNYSLIMDTDFHTVGEFTKMPEADPIVLEDDVWLAARVIVLKGVRIGRGSVVSAGSVVATNVPPFTLVGGVPARPIRRLEPKPESAPDTAKTESKTEPAPDTAKPEVKTLIPQANPSGPYT